MTLLFIGTFPFPNGKTDLFACGDKVRDARRIECEVLNVMLVAYSLDFCRNKRLVDDGARNCC